MLLDQVHPSSMFRSNEKKIIKKEIKKYGIERLGTTKNILVR